jgi:hypothetical protein
MLNDIANADDTDEFAVSNHEQMPQTVIRPTAHGGGNRPALETV